MELFKRIGVLCLCGLLMLRVMVAPIVYLEYEFNKEYIIKNYCINKNRPQLHCDGKCYLAKKLRDAQDKDERQSKISAIRFLLEVYQSCQNCFKDLNTTKAFIDKILQYAYSESFSKTTITSIFRPPKFN